MESLAVLQLYMMLHCLAYITYLWKRIQAAPLLSTLLLVPSSELSV